jgi:hypothetical protein
VRLIAIVAAAAFLMLPAVAPAQAHHGKGGAHAEDAYAAGKKKAKKAKRTKTPKEQYMRAVPSR